MALNYHMASAVFALAALSASPAQAQTNPLEVQQQGHISYVTGGIGKDEIDAMQATQSNYNLRIMNADKAGHFSGNTRIVISDLQHTALLDAASGPLLYANLPQGRYIVEGYSQERMKKQTITIGHKKPARVRFVWPEDMTDAANH